MREGTQEEGRKETDFGLWASAEATIMVKTLLGDNIFKCHLLPSPSNAPLAEILFNYGQEPGAHCVKIVRTEAYFPVGSHSAESETVNTYTELAYLDLPKCGRSLTVRQKDE